VELAVDSGCRSRCSRNPTRNQNIEHPDRHRRMRRLTHSCSSPCSSWDSTTKAQIVVAMGSGCRSRCSRNPTRSRQIVHPDRHRRMRRLTHSCSSPCSSWDSTTKAQIVVARETVAAGRSPRTGRRWCRGCVASEYGSGYGCVASEYGSGCECATVSEYGSGYGCVASEYGSGCECATVSESEASGNVASGNAASASVDYGCVGCACAAAVTATVAAGRAMAVAVAMQRSMTVAVTMSSGCRSRCSRNPMRTQNIEHPDRHRRRCRRPHRCSSPCSSWGSTTKTMVVVDAVKAAVRRVNNYQQCNPGCTALRIHWNSNY
jgi:hypothetical protein